MRTPGRATFLMFMFAVSARAATVTKLSGAALAPLRSAGPRLFVDLERVPLLPGRDAIIHLEPFDVWTPDATITIHGADGSHVVSPPDTRYFRGKVEGYEGSMAVFSVGATIEGLVTLGDRRFT